MTRPPSHLQTRRATHTHIPVCPCVCVVVFASARMGLPFFFLRVKERGHLFSLMAKWFYSTQRLIACDMRGGVTATLFICDLGRLRGTAAKIPSVVISGQLCFVELAQSQRRRWSNATCDGAFRLTIITHYASVSICSPPSHGFMLAGASRADGWIHCPFCPSAKSHLQAHYAE